MKVSKGLKFPVVALPGVVHMPAEGEDEMETARVFYVAATRATQCATALLRLARSLLMCRDFQIAPLYLAQ